eukprot:273848_1
MSLTPSEIAAGDCSNVVNGGNSSTCTRSLGRIELHPLCIISISDHYMRVSMGGGKQSSDAKIVGLLMGTEDGLDISIYDAVEVVYDVGMEMEEGGGSGETVALNVDIVKKQKELFTAVYSNYNVLGWYSVGEEVCSEDAFIHKQIQQFNQNPLFLLMNPKAVEGSKNMPILLHEGEVHVVNDCPTTIFVTLNFQITMMAAEEASAEHISRAKTPGETGLESHFGALGTSLRALKSRISVLKLCLEKIQAGNLPPDWGLLREISSLTTRLEMRRRDGVSELQFDFNQAHSDVLLLTYLAALQEATSNLSMVARKCDYSAPTIKDAAAFRTTLGKATVGRAGEISGEEKDMLYKFK